MSTHMAHCYHMVEVSPWPLMASSGAGLLVLGLILLISFNKISILSVGGLSLLLTAGQWWRDISREASYQGLHTGSVQWNMRWGMLLFIVSEVLFFFSFFWAYFNSSLAPGAELGLSWPPSGVEAFNPFGIPLLNTTILLSSGLTVTWSHHDLMRGEHSKSGLALALTVGLGLYFTMIQGFEYLQSGCSLKSVALDLWD